MLWLRWRRWPSPQSVPKGRVTTRASTKALEATVLHRSQSALLDIGPVHILGDNTTPPGDIDLKSGIGRPPSPPLVAPSQMHENTATDSTGHPCARTAIEAGQSVNSTSLQGVRGETRQWIAGFGLGFAHTLSNPKPRSFRSLRQVSGADSKFWSHIGLLGRPSRVDPGVPGAL